MSARIAVLPKRGLRRDQAANYLGVSATKFDQWVEVGRMPKGFRVDGCLIWDVYDLDAAFDEMKAQGRENRDNFGRF